MKNNFFRKNSQGKKKYRIIPFTIFECIMMVTNIGIITSIWLTCLLSN